MEEKKPTLKDLKESSKYLISITEKISLNEVERKLSELKTELNSLKKSFTEELLYIKAQTLTKKTADSVISKAKNRIISLKERMEMIIPAIQKYEVTLKKLTNQLNY